MSGQIQQTDKQGRLKHFLTTEGLSQSLLQSILDHAENFAGVADRPVKKVPLLRGKTVVNLFFEASTRTRTTFELARHFDADQLELFPRHNGRRVHHRILNCLVFWEGHDVTDGGRAENRH